MLSKALATIIDPDILILKGLKTLTLGVKELVAPFTFTVEGFPLFAIGIGLGVAFVAGKVLEYQFEHNPTFKAKIQTAISSGKSTKLILIASGIITILIFAL